MFSIGSTILLFIAYYLIGVKLEPTGAFFSSVLGLVLGMIGTSREKKFFLALSIVAIVLNSLTIPLSFLLIIIRPAIPY